MTDYDRIITAIKADIEKQKETVVNPSARIFIGGEMRAIEIIEELKMESVGTQITNSNLKSESEIKVDLISRDEAVECCFNGWNKDFNEIAEDIKKLPTYPANLVKESGVLVKDLVKEDLISRQAVLDFTTEWCNRCGKRKEYDGVLCKCCDLADTIDFVEELPTIPQTDISSIIERLRKAEEVFRKNGEQASLEANGIHYAIEVIEQFTPQTAIKHFGAMECPNCGALFYEIPTIETVLEEIKAEISQINTNYCGGYWGLSKQEVIDIIDKHISRKE